MPCTPGYEIDLVYVWSCCAYEQVVHIEYANMHC